MPSPDASELHRFLTQQRTSLTQQRRELLAMVKAQAPADQLSAAAGRLMRRIDRHLAQLYALGNLMAGASTGEPVLNETMKVAGKALLSHEAQLRKPDSSLMKNRRAAVQLLEASKG